MSEILVKKFGGTSVGSTKRILAIAEGIKVDHGRGETQVIVLSAMAGETNRLVDLVRHSMAEDGSPDAGAADLAYATGEQVSIALMAVALQSLGVPASPYCGWQLPVRTTDDHGKARITDISTERIHADLSQGRVVLVAGFQGISESGRVSTLGRGGSDTSAVALAVSLRARECRIYTDVAGIYNADPRLIAEARALASITFEEMLELASLGSKVLLARSVELASKNNLPIRVLSSFVPGTGTLVTNEQDNMESALISGIAHNADEAQLTLVGVPDRPGIAAQILGRIADANIEVDMIVQNTGADGNTDFTFTVHRRDYAQGLQILESLRAPLGVREVKGNNEIVKLSLVGVGMRSHAGIASRVFSALAARNINIMMISTSEIKISLCIEQSHLEEAARALFDEFDLGAPDGGALAKD
ncbi:MAG: aspartate kinase [Gammaproteobacteria bacterium]|nr:aspartate kinase [Pseudomonadota bacterium]MCH9663178.1 aspartate kinase [Gammaproteobacteria bacterium]